MLATPRRYRFQTASEPFPHRANMNREIALPASLTDVRDPRKSNVGGFRGFSPVGSFPKVSSAHWSPPSPSFAWRDEFPIRTGEEGCRFGDVTKVGALRFQRRRQIVMT